MRIGLETRPDRISLRVGTQNYRFTRSPDKSWFLDDISVNGIVAAVPLSPNDSFVVGGGTAGGFSIEADDKRVKRIAFTLKTGVVTYEVRAAEKLPLAHIAITGPASATIAFRTPAAAPDQRGGWVTRGETAADAEAREVYIDGSGPLVFGHCKAGALNTGYVVLAEVNRHIQKNGRTEQASNTWFKSGRREVSDGNFAGYWQLRMGEGEPTRCAMLVDRNSGGRCYSVCEKYYAPAVDALVNLAQCASDYDPDLALQKMPLRLAAPDAFVPGYGWTMAEYRDAAYPYGHDSSIQIGNMLAYEGMATGRDWERNFGNYVLDKSPLLGNDGESFFVHRPGGITRWGYASDYKHPFSRLDGGNWGDAQALYTTAKITGDAKLKKFAMEMMKHDINVKLDLDKMTFPPCWDAVRNAPGDRRDDWAITALLAYAAEICSEILYPETKNPVYLQKADRICAWFKDKLGPETQKNYLHDGVNTYHCWAGWIPAMLIHKYERSHDAAYLDIARDFAWTLILTLGLTTDKDPRGQSFLGVTCVGVRGCIDYDCAPNLCQEKDQFFIASIGALLNHVRGPAYAKYLYLQRLALPRDRWNDAFGVQELRDTNLRTMYDTYARGIANLIYALDKSRDPNLVVVEKNVATRATNLATQRNILVANATSIKRETLLQVRYLASGTYHLVIDEKVGGEKSSAELASGIPLVVPANTQKSVRVTLVAHHPVVEGEYVFDPGITPLSELTTMGAQRGVGLPTPIFVKNKSFGGNPLRIRGMKYRQGLGCAANTVLRYRLDAQYGRFQATVGLDDEITMAANPAGCVRFTVFADGVCKFDSGAMTARTPAQYVDVDLKGVKDLMLRVSGNWNSEGQTENNHGDWADAKLVGRKWLLRNTDRP